MLAAPSPWEGRTHRRELAALRGASASGLAITVAIMTNIDSNC